MKPYVCYLVLTVALLLILPYAQSQSSPTHIVSPSAHLMIEPRSNSSQAVLSWKFSWATPVYAGQAFEFHSTIRNEGPPLFKVTRVQLDWDWGVNYVTSDVPITIDPLASHSWNFTVDVPNSAIGLHRYSFNIYVEIPTGQEGQWSNEISNSIGGNLEIQSTSIPSTTEPASTSQTTTSSAQAIPINLTVVTQPNPLDLYMPVFTLSIGAVVGIVATWGAQRWRLKKDITGERLRDFYTPLHSYAQRGRPIPGDFWRLMNSTEKGQFIGILEERTHLALGGIHELIVNDLLPLKSAGQDPLAEQSLRIELQKKIIEDYGKLRRRY